MLARSWISAPQCPDAAFVYVDRKPQSVLAGESSSQIYGDQQVLPFLHETYDRQTESGCEHGGHVLHEICDDVDDAYVSTALCRSLGNTLALI
jgi:hypothetical protein